MGICHILIYKGFFFLLDTEGKFSLMSESCCLDIRYKQYNLISVYEICVADVVRAWRKELL